MLPPRVLFVHAGAELYGADRILLELAAGLLERGHGLHVVLPGPGPLHHELQQLGVPTQQCNLGVLRRRYFNPRGLLNRVCRVLGAVWHLRQLVRAKRIDIVHSNTTAVIAGAVAAWLAGVPHVWHVHEITTRPRWLARGMAAFVGLMSQRAVFVSEATRQHMVSLNPRVQTRAVVIHNGIDPARALAGCPGVLRAELGWAADAVVVGMIGRINWWKGQGQLLECAMRLSSSKPGLRFLMVGGTFEGDNRVRDELLAGITAQRLEAVVSVLDFRPDVGNVLADIDIFVLPSTEPDPFPTVVLEAMAAARPVVAFRHGGVCEMVADGESGLLCAPGSTEEMTAAISRLAASPALRQRMGQSGRERLQRLFTREAFIERFVRLYRELTPGA